MSAESPVSRTQLLRVIPAAVGAVVLGPAVVKPAAAALPTSEDYDFGTGSKVWVVCENVIYHVCCTAVSTQQSQVTRASTLSCQ